MVGAELVISNLHEKLMLMQLAADQAVKDWVTTTGLISVNDLCPEKTGLLKSTYKEEVIYNSLELFTIRMSYGGNGLAFYAVYVHEMAKPYHPHGSWKYLTIAINRRVSYFVYDITKACGEAII
jgi:hypothetical protein